MRDLYRVLWTRHSLAGSSVYCLLLLLAIFVISGMLSGLEGSSDTGQKSSFHVLASSEDEIVLELRLPEWHASVRQTGSFQFDEVEVPGFSVLTEPGEPRIPVAYATIGIPPGVTPRLKVIEVDRIQQYSQYELAANPIAVPAMNQPSLASASEPAFMPTTGYEPATGRDFYPGEIVQMIDEGWMFSTGHFFLGERSGLFRAP